MRLVFRKEPFLPNQYILTMASYGGHISAQILKCDKARTPRANGMGTDAHDQARGTAQRRQISKDARNFFGGHRGEGTPDPIPNSEVKLSIADDTA